jgi:protein-tyrosine-phosphatase
MRMGEHETGAVRRDLPLRVLFVCVENSCRSQMAEGFAKARGDAHVSAHSAGSNPSGRVDPRAARLMLERGIDLASHESKGLEDLPPGIVWDCIVTMGCGDVCPHLSSKRRLDWDLPDPKPLTDDEFRRIRDRIETLVRDVLNVAT